MRRWIRRLSLGASVLLVGMLALLGALVTGVDRRPLTEGPLPESMARRLAALAAARPLESPVTGFRVGWARTSFTPRVGSAADRPEVGEFRDLPLAGYGNRGGKPATGTHDALWAKAIAVATAHATGVIVAVDALIVPREVADAAIDEIKERTGLGRESIYFGATHTHCGPGGWGDGLVAEAFAGGFRPATRHWMARQLAEAATAATANLGLGEVASGGFAAPDLVRNRLVGDQGVVDPEFSLLAFRKADGSNAILGAFSAHATVLGSGMMQFSGDYPGAWARAVEARGAGLAMFLAGGVGSHAPRPPRGGVDGVEAMGARLAERTAAALSALTYTNRAEFALCTLELDLPELQARLADGLRLRPWVARRLLPVGSRSRLQALRMGDAVWFSTPCDYSGELALELKAAARVRGLRATVTSFNGDYLGYVVPARYYGLDTYETRTMAFFGPQLPDYFDAGLRGLLDVVGPPPGRTVASPVLLKTSP